MRNLKPWAFLALAAVVYFAFPEAQAFAQEAAESAPAATSSDADITLMKILQWGGVVGAIVILMSVAMVALVIEHFVSLQRDKIVPREVISELEQLFEEEEYQEALDVCEQEPNFLTNMLAAALPKLNAGFDTMEEVMDEQYELEATKLFSKISYLSLIANVAPMMGLFGTVLGMVGAFNEIVRLGANVTPKDLAGGVQQALITTLFGLAVAIPSVMFYFFFRNKVVGINQEIKSIADDLIDRFRPQRA